MVKKYILGAYKQILTLVFGVLSLLLVVGCANQLYDSQVDNIKPVWLYDNSQDFQKEDQDAYDLAKNQQQLEENNGSDLNTDNSINNAAQDQQQLEENNGSDLNTDNSINNAAQNQQQLEENNGSDLNTDNSINNAAQNQQQLEENNGSDLNTDNSINNAAQEEQNNYQDTDSIFKKNQELDINGQIQKDFDVALNKKIGRKDVVGFWKITTDSGQCQLYLSLSSWQYGSRASTRGCSLNEIVAVSAWVIKEDYIVLKNKMGKNIVKLFRSGRKSFEGTTSENNSITILR